MNDKPTIDIKGLKERGWTDALISKFLGEADHWESVSHWANFTGKKLYFLSKVEGQELSQKFCEAYSISLSRRKISSKDALAYEVERKERIIE
jgi:hypothetical protein